MAQHFDIPIAFNFACERRNWRAFSFVALTEDEEVPLSADSVVDIRLVQDEANPHPYLSGNNLFGSFGKREQAFLGSVAQLRIVHKLVPESMSQVIVSNISHSATPRNGDAWEMRSEFLRLEESNVALVTFLNKWGAWGEDSFFRPVIIPFRRWGGPVDVERPAFIFPFLVWERRKILRAGILSKPAPWLGTEAALGTLHRRQQFPYMGVTHTACVQAIEATITIDHLRKVKHRICARADCDNIFPVDSDHGKIYCEQYCGHLVSVRRKRAAAKKAAKNAKGKKA